MHRTLGMDFLPPDGKWWQLENLARRIGLTQGEIDQLDQAFLESRRKMIQLKTTLETEQFELEALIEGASINETSVFSQYEKLETARRALGMERFRFFLSVRKIIGHDKFQKLLLIKRERDRRRDR
ncbi:MAG: hypothetical protein V2B19_27535 [Pseudomonadota bacterium]